MLEWLKRVDCKSISFAYTGSNPVFPRESLLDLTYQPVALKFWRLAKRMTGIEPVASAWKAEVLPLYDIRFYFDPRLAARGPEGPKA